MRAPGGMRCAGVVGDGLNALECSSHISTSTTRSRFAAGIHTFPSAPTCSICLARSGVGLWRESIELINARTLSPTTSLRGNSLTNAATPSAMPPGTSKTMQSGTLPFSTRCVPKSTGRTTLGKAPAYHSGGFGQVGSHLAGGRRSCFRYMAGSSDAPGSQLAGRPPYRSLSAHLEGSQETVLLIVHARRWATARHRLSSDRDAPGRSPGHTKAR